MPQVGQARGSPPRPRAGEDVRPEHVVQRVEHLGDAQFLDLLHGGDEVAPEIAEHVLPVELAGGDQVELFLEVGGEVVFDVAREEALEERRDDAAAVLGDEAALVEPHIVAVAQDVERRGIGRGAADAELLHLLDQARLGVARRRLGEVLLRCDLAVFELIALRRAAAGATVLVARVVGAFLSRA